MTVRPQPNRRAKASAVSRSVRVSRPAYKISVAAFHFVMGWARTYCRYRQESVSPKSVAISPSRSSRVSSTRAKPIPVPDQLFHVQHRRYQQRLLRRMSARASRENHAPMLLERRLMRPQRPRRYAITPRSSGTTCQGTKPDSSFRAPCSGRSMASTCAPLGQTISPKAAPSSLQPHLPWTNSQTRSDGSAV